MNIKSGIGVKEARQTILFEGGGAIPTIPHLLVLEVDNAIVDNLLIKNHYSRRITTNRWRSFGIFHHQMLVGAMQIGYGIRPQIKDKIIRGGDSETVKEFDRMYVDDTLPKNSESRIIGYLLRYLRKKYPGVKVLISYADGIRGNIGTIYQATNFDYIGRVRGEFYYIPSKDEWVHPVSMYHRHNTRNIETLRKIYPDIQHIRGWHYRYVYFLDPKWKERLLVPIQPYPKKENSPNRNYYRKRYGNWMTGQNE